MKKLKLLSTVLALGMVMSLSAKATTINFYQSGSDQNLGFQNNFGGIVASAFSFTYNDPSSPDFNQIHWADSSLYQSNTNHGLSEAGLGVNSKNERGSGNCSDGQTREINCNEFIRLDFSNLASNSEFLNSELALTLASVQTGETATIYLGHPDHTSATTSVSASGTGSTVVQTFSLFNGSMLVGSNGFNNLYIVGGNKDVLLQSISAVPEPGTLTLMGLGLLGLVFSAKRKRNTRI